MEKKKFLRHCMMVSRAPSTDNKMDDALIVKERLRDPETGKEKPHLRIVENYQRPFWLSKKSMRHEHKQKREYEFDYNLDEYSCTQAELPYKVNRLLGNPCGGFPRMGTLAESPYLYGSDITSSVLYMNEQTLRNKELNNNWVPDFSLAVMDFETNVHTKDEEIISGALSFKDKAIVFATESFMAGIINPEEKMQEAVQHYLKKEIIERGMTIKTIIVKNEMALVRRIMNVAHALKPDFLAFWNMSFDIKKMLTACERYRVNPADVFSDPSIPKKYRFYRWTEDKPNRVTASGKKKNKDISETWNKLEAPSSFYIIDAMSSFRMLRAVEPKRHSYSFDAISKDEGVDGKMDFNAVEGNHNIAWHRKMQKGHKLPYVAYNLKDCIGVEELDEKTNDLAKKIGLYADGSELTTLSSNPKRLANAIHIFLRHEGKVICSTSSDMTEPFDHLVLDKKNYIVTLANELSAKTGTSIFTELPDLLSRLARSVYDVDITSGYPSSQIIGNISKSTTLTEVCQIQGLSRPEVKQTGVNLMAIPANAVELGEALLGLPGLDGLEKELTGIDSLESLEAVLKLAA